MSRRNFDRDPADLFPALPPELEASAQKLHAEFEGLAEVAAAATARARKVSAGGAEPELTVKEQYAVAYVAGVRPTTGMIVKGHLQMTMPPLRIAWDKEGGRFVVQQKGT